MSVLKHGFLLLVAITSIDCLASSLSRSAGTPKHFYQVRSLIVCKMKCESECNSTNSIWERFECNKCMQDCIRKENMIFEDGPKKYRKLSDNDDLYEPPWFVSQIISERTITITDLECGYTYQFRLTLINTKIIDRRTSMWISNKHLCRY